jgi:hypothetical protein
MASTDQYLPIWFIEITKKKPASLVASYVGILSIFQNYCVFMFYYPKSRWTLELSVISHFSNNESPKSQIFFKYNNYKNHIINNKSDKNKILYLRMAACHCQWRGANTPLSVTFLLKRVTANDAFVSYKY